MKWKRIQAGFYESGDYAITRGPKGWWMVTRRHYIVAVRIASLSSAKKRAEEHAQVVSG